MTGSAVNMLQMRFFLDWGYVSRGKFKINHPSQVEFYFPPPEETGDMGVQIVSSGPDADGEQIKNGYIKMINAAQKKLYIQSPYFVPDEIFMNALSLAAASGVDVRVMIPGIPDKKYVYWATKSYVDELLKCGIRVYWYNGFLHAKMLVIDSSVATVGTTNIDNRSFRLDFEVNAFVYDESFARQCEETFLADTESSVEADIETHAGRGLKSRILESLFRLVALFLKGWAGGSAGGAP
jgi:cardiolipin synthase